MSESSERLKKLEAIGELLATELAMVPDTDYLVCAVSKTKDGKSAASMLYTNLHWYDRETGERQRPTLGMLTDLIVAARFAVDGKERNEESLRQLPFSEREM